MEALFYFALLYSTPDTRPVMLLLLLLTWPHPVSHSFLLVSLLMKPNFFLNHLNGFFLSTPDEMSHYTGVRCAVLIFEYVITMAGRVKCRT